MFKKISYLLLFLILFNLISFSFAKTKVVYEKAFNLANTYIENSINDDSWFENNPKISWKWKYYYTDDDKNPSYIEFKVSCKKEINCWFILVNVDWDDVSVPIASTSWVWPSEILESKNWNTKNNKLYYFWAFDQYIENLDNWNVLSINPNDDIENKLLNFQNLDKIELKEKEKIAKDELKQKLKDLKKEAKEYKKSIDFKNKKEEIKDQILQLPKEEFVINNLDMSYASYTPPAYSSNVFVPGVHVYSWSNYNCWGLVPCYNQYMTTYYWNTCAVWCVPVAWWMIYWYYDRKWQFPNLIPWTAPTINNSTINNVIKDIWENYVNTKCNINWGITWDTSLSDAVNWINYAIDKWYTNSTSQRIKHSNLSTIFYHIKDEIYNWRPVIVNTGSHSMVAFWYYNWWQNIVRINVWYWHNNKISDWIYSYYLSNMEYNINSIYYWSNTQKLESLIKINISN